MKILLINDYGSAAGGAELLVLALRDRLRELGHDARIFTSSARPPGTTLSSDYHCFGTLSRFRTLLQTANPWAYHSLRKVLGEFQPDVVHATLFLTQLSPLILPLLRKVPTVYYAAWHRAVCPVGTKLLPSRRQCSVKAGLSCLKNRCLPWRDWLLHVLQKHLLGKWWHSIDVVVAASEDLADSLARDGLKVNEVVWSGVKERPLRPRLGDPPVVAFAGRLVKEKGIDVLCRAFALLTKSIPDAQLLIAGTGPEKSNIEDLVRSLRLTDSVRMLGQLSPQQLYDVFSPAWVQVVPSLCREGFGMAAAEAMIRGTAVIASDIGGLKNFVSSAGCLLVPPGDVEALSQAMLCVLQDSGTAESMGLRARTFALERLTAGRFAEQLVEIYRKLCSIKETANVS